MMDTSDIQAFRKKRLQELIDTFFAGSRTALGRCLKNKHGQFMENGHYVGQMLRPAGNAHARPIDEYRVAEIESLQPAFKGWFDHDVPATPSEETNAGTWRLVIGSLQALLMTLTDDQRKAASSRLEAALQCNATTKCGETHNLDLQPGVCS